MRILFCLILIFGFGCSHTSTSKKDHNIEPEKAQPISVPIIFSDPYAASIIALTSIALDPKTGQQLVPRKDQVFIHCTISPKAGPPAPCLNVDMKVLFGDSDKEVAKLKMYDSDFAISKLNPSETYTIIFSGRNVVTKKYSGVGPGTEMTIELSFAEKKSKN